MFAFNLIRVEFNGPLLVQLLTSLFPGLPADRNVDRLALIRFCMTSNTFRY
jgi:hypothetical protein